jgi:hypothetical protein
MFKIFSAGSAAGQWVQQPRRGHESRPRRGHESRPLGGNGPTSDFPAGYVMLNAAAYSGAERQRIRENPDVRLIPE